MNVLDIAQVRPDLLVQVAAGPHGGGCHFLEYERTASVVRAQRKPLTYCRMAELGRTLPVLLVCESPDIEDYYLSAGGFPLLTNTMERAMAGPLTGADTMWRSVSGKPVALHCHLAGATAPVTCRPWATAAEPIFNLSEFSASFGSLDVFGGGTGSDFRGSDGGDFGGGDGGDGGDIGISF